MNVCMLNNATLEEGGQAPSHQNIQMNTQHTLAVPKTLHTLAVPNILHTLAVLNILHTLAVPNILHTLAAPNILHTLAVPNNSECFLAVFRIRIRFILDSRI